jgi:hypothetical protein
MIPADAGLLGVSAAGRVFDSLTFQQKQKGSAAVVTIAEPFISSGKRD